MLSESQEAMWCEQRKAVPGRANLEMQEEGELNNDSGECARKTF
jgi:hypothetical protein